MWSASLCPCYLVTLMYVYSVLTADGNWGEWSMWSKCLCPLLFSYSDVFLLCVNS